MLMAEGVAIVDVDGRGVESVDVDGRWMESVDVDGRGGGECGC